MNRTLSRDEIGNSGYAIWSIPFFHMKCLGCSSMIVLCPTADMCFLNINLLQGRKNVWKFRRANTWVPILCLVIPVGAPEPFRGTNDFIFLEGEIMPLPWPSCGSIPSNSMLIFTEYIFKTLPVKYFSHTNKNIPCRFNKLAIPFVDTFRQLGATW